MNYLCDITGALGASLALSCNPQPSPSPSVSASPTATTDPRAGKLHVWNRIDPAIWQTANNYEAAVFLPKDYGSDPAKKYCMVVSMYGTGGQVLNATHTALASSGEGFITRVWDGATLQNTFPCVVLAPEARAKGQAGAIWWTPTALAEVIDAAIVTYKIDPKRVTATGLSAGGQGTNALIRDYTSKISGAMPVAFMAPDVGGAFPDPCTAAALPIWSFGNADDQTFNAYSWTTFKTAISACPGFTSQFTLTVNPVGGHWGWDQFYSRADVQAWLISQVKP